MYVIELKASSGRARRPDLRGRLADAILQARARSRESDASPLAVLAAPSISDGMAKELGDYVQRYGDGVAWGLVDERGRFELHGPGLDDIRAEIHPDEVNEIHEARRSSSPAHNPYADLGQWMLKVLLADKVPEPLLYAPRRRPRGVAELADLAGVSPSSASRFLAALHADGHVAESKSGIKLVRIASLLEKWRMSSQGPMEEQRVRFLLPAADPLLRIQEVLARRGSPEAPDGERAGPRGERACMASFAACRLFGVGFVRNAPIHIYSESLSASFLRSLELQPVDNRAEADLVVRRPRFPESVFRACVLVAGVPVSDILQCWVDVSFHAARGEEQAALIAEHLHFQEWKP